MTTLAVMKDRIAREVRRASTMTTEIAEAISTAIQAYQDERFHFNESRSTTFSTVAGQEFYDGDDESDLDLLIKIDYVNILIGSTVFTLSPDIPATIESAANDATATGQPGWYVYYGRQLRLYPNPASVYTVRVAGLYKLPEPASDAATGNFWMTDAERLIRSRAKMELALHVLRDMELAQSMGEATTEALNQLKRWTNKLTQRGDGRVAPMNY